MNEKKAIAIMIANLKRYKNKPSNLLDFAEACGFLKKKWGLDKMASFFSASKYMLRQIDKINYLNPDVRKLVGAGKIRIEQANQLSRIDKKRQSEAAKEIIGLTAHETRTFVSLLLKSDLSVKECKKRFAKDFLKKVNLLVLPMPDNTFRNLKKHATKSRINMHDLALQILENYLEARQT